LNSQGVTANKIVGILTDSTIDNMSGLTIVDLRQNSFSGTIPDFDTTVLEKLYLSNNLLIGTIPSSFGLITPLQIIHLEGNSLSKSIPSTLSNLVNLVDFNAQHNDLTGTLPDLYPAFSMTTSSAKLVLSYNKLTGPIPTSVSTLKGLYQFDISHNSFASTIPSFFSALPALGSLRISFNSFYGTIPSAIGIYYNKQNITKIL